MREITSRCQNCKFLKVYKAGYGAQRKQCYCEHPHAKTVYKKYAMKGDPAFIGFTAKMCSVPAIKTSPKWCPIRVQNMSDARMDGEADD